jgi:hypothetical protein
MRRWKMIAMAAGMVTTVVNAQEPVSVISEGGSIGMQRHAVSQNAGMPTPEMQQMMIEYRQQLRERMGLRTVMRHPKVIKTMLSDMLDTPEVVEKVLNDNPLLKAKLKEVL